MKGMFLKLQHTINISLFTTTKKNLIIVIPTIQMWKVSSILLPSYGDIHAYVTLHKGIVVTSPFVISQKSSKNIYNTSPDMAQ